MGSGSQGTDAHVAPTDRDTLEAWLSDVITAALGEMSQTTVHRMQRQLLTNAVRLGALEVGSDAGDDHIRSLCRQAFRRLEAIELELEQATSL